MKDSLDAQESPLVSIYCLVYNHAPFLRQCLDGFVMQKTAFRVEVHIHDDASKDDSQSIIQEYVEAYPNIIWCPIYQKRNIFSQGLSPGCLLLPQIKGKYVVCCEGDDYWTDPLKLQKQVDFMEANPDVSICHHSARVVWDKGEQPDTIYPPQADEKGYREELFVNDFLNHHWLATASVMFRWCFNRSDLKFEEQYPKNILSVDTILFLFHAVRGRVIQIPGVMSVYRRHSGGLTYSRDANDDSYYTKNALKLLNFFSFAEKITGQDYSAKRREQLLNCIMACVTTGNGDVLNQLKEQYPDDYEIVTRPYLHSERCDEKKKWKRLIATTPIMKFLCGKVKKLFKLNF